MLLGSITVWLALVFGLKLWALVFASSLKPWYPAMSSSSLSVTFSDSTSILVHGLFLQVDARRRTGPMENALISASFHFATQFFTIIVCKFHSDSEAAPLGMTLSIPRQFKWLPWRG